MYELSLNTLLCTIYNVTTYLCPSHEYKDTQYQGLLALIVVFKLQWPVFHKTSVILVHSQVLNCHIP